MGRKEDRMYDMGFARACEIAKTKGLDALMAEQRMRGACPYGPETCRHCTGTG